MSDKRRIVILGGGVGAMTAAFELTNWDGWQDGLEIDVYQMGWRLGGKGASGRRQDLADRIEEHGLHVWMGFYENAFHVIRQAYDECTRRNLTPGSPFRSWQDAFLRQDYARTWSRRPMAGALTITSRPTMRYPRNLAVRSTAAGALTLGSLRHRPRVARAPCEELEALAGDHPAPLHLASILTRLVIDAEQRASRCSRPAQTTHCRGRPCRRCAAALLGVRDMSQTRCSRDRTPHRSRSAPRHAFYLVDTGVATSRGLIATM